MELILAVLWLTRRQVAFRRRVLQETVKSGTLGPTGGDGGFQQSAEEMISVKTNKQTKRTSPLFKSLLDLRGSVVVMVTVMVAERHFRT